MMRHVLVVAAFVIATPASAIRWPLTNGNQQHSVTGTLGEYRPTGGSPHFHDGVDITTAPTNQGPDIFAVTAGSVLSRRRNLNSDDFLAVQGGGLILIYYHMTPDASLVEGTPIGINDPLGAIASFTPAHLHFKITDTFGIQTMNALLVPTGGLTPYGDTALPSVSLVQFFDGTQPLGSSEIDISSPTQKTSIVIRAKAKDAQSLGSSNVGVFSVGYKVINPDSGFTIMDRSIQQSYPAILKQAVDFPYIAYETTLSNLTTYFYYASNMIEAVAPLNLQKFSDGNYKICVVAKDVKGNGGNTTTQTGAECKTYRLDRTAPIEGLLDGNGASLFNGVASSMTTITVTSTDTFGLAQIALAGPSPDTRSVSGLTATETFTGLADGSYIATVTDLAGNSAQAAFIVSTSTPNAETRDDMDDPITNEISSSRCLVPHGTAAMVGIASTSISGAGLSKTMIWPCGVPAKSTDVYVGAFCNLVENSTYTYTVTSCSGKETTSPEITVTTSTRGGRICVTSPAGTFCGGTGALSAAQISEYGVNMRVCTIVWPSSCSSSCDYFAWDSIVSAPAGFAYCGVGPSCCRVVGWSSPLSSKSFIVSNTTTVASRDSGSYQFTIAKPGSEGQVSIATLKSPNFKMEPGQQTIGFIDISQIGQGYATSSPDGVANVSSPFTRLHFSLRDWLEFLLGLSRQILRASSPYVYNYLGSDAIFNSTTTLTLSYVDAVNTDTTTVRIYMFDGVSWSSSGIANQLIAYSTTTQVITASGSVDRTGLYAALYQAQDSSAPITTFSVQGSTFNFDGALFVSTDSYIVLTATDPVVNGFASTVASTTYRIDPSSDSQFYIYTSSIPLPLGTHIFEYRSLDYAGNAETVKTATFTVTAGAAMRGSSTAQVPGTLLNGFLGSGAKLEVESQAQNSLTLMISSVNRQAMVSVDNIGEIGIGVTPQSNLNIGQDSIGLQLRSGNSTSAVTSSQIALAYNGDNSMRHLLRTEHSTATPGNKFDFLVWNTGAGSTTTLASLDVLSLQGIATASGGSFHVQPVGEPDAEVEVSNGLSTGGGTMQRLQVVSPSSRRFKTNIKNLKERDENRALEDVAALKHARFRYKSRQKDGRLLEDPAQPLRTGLIYEEAPESIRAGKEALSTSERLVNVEMALKASMRRLEELQKRYEKLKARRTTP